MQIPVQTRSAGPHGGVFAPPCPNGRIKKERNLMRKRTSGILLHISSLPGRFGIGDLGTPARAFADFLHQSGQSLWQTLPLNSISPFQHFSPYSSNSSLAISLHYLSPELLLEQDLIGESDLRFKTDNPEDNQQAFRDAYRFKSTLASKAYSRYKTRGTDSQFENFCRENRHWLEDHALFIAVSESMEGKPWTEWPSPLKHRDPDALERVRQQLSGEIEKEKFIQYLLDMQIWELRRYCRERGIQIIGDIPFYVNQNSADVWAHPQLFKLNEDLSPSFLSGVPPDRFSSTGQLWGNPVYDWGQMAREKYRWWIDRFQRTFRLYDMVRIDHFRGFVAYWQVPNPSPNASRGEWVKSPAKEFFRTMLGHFACFPVIAEDLGSIDSDVREVMHEMRFPGTKVLLFAFDDADPENPYLPHNLPRNCMACTGTHDTNTVKGWLETEADEKMRDNLYRYLGRHVPDGQMHWELIRLLMMSPAQMVITPLQDALGLGEESRMNRPGKFEGNWLWRAPDDYARSEAVQKLGEMSRVYGRI
ncbi:MAG: 4-alpha-glucanotransferase [Fibrobacterota bacterium]